MTLLKTQDILIASVGLGLAVCAAVPAAARGPARQVEKTAWTIRFAAPATGSGYLLGCSVQRGERSAAVKITNRDPFWLQKGRVLAWRTSGGRTGRIALPYALHSGKSFRIYLPGGAGTTCSASVR